MNETSNSKKSRLIMITGGQRSGKSAFAEKLVLSLCNRPIYLATAQIFDAEMQHRVEIHKQRRQNKWLTIESPLYISENEFHETDVVLLECITLLTTNWFFKLNESVDDALTEIKRQLSSVMATGATFVMVTNEIGLGGISANPMQRHFTDLQGAINQYLASLADEVYMTVSGIPVKIKSSNEEIQHSSY